MQQPKKDFSYERQPQVFSAVDATSQPVHVELAHVIEMNSAVRVELAQVIEMKSVGHHLVIFGLVIFEQKARPSFGARSRVTHTFPSVFGIPVIPALQIPVEVILEENFLAGQEGSGKAGKAVFDRFRERNGLIADGALRHG